VVDVKMGRPVVPGVDAELDVADGVQLAYIRPASDE